MLNVSDNKKVYGIVIAEYNNINESKTTSNIDKNLCEKLKNLENNNIENKKLNNYISGEYLKFKIRDYLKDNQSNCNGNQVFINDSFNFDNIYQQKRGSNNNSEKKIILENLLSFIDIRLFGIECTIKNKNISIHGAVQVSYGKQVYSNNYYLHHFSINPSNLPQVIESSKEKKIIKQISEDDINCLKDSLKNNPLLMWIEVSKNTVLRNFSDLIVVSRENGNYKINLTEVCNYLKEFKTFIKSVEIYCNKKNNLINKKIFDCNSLSVKLSNSCEFEKNNDKINLSFKEDENEQ